MFYFTRAKPTQSTDNHERNEQLTLQWAKTSMEELRLEMKEMAESLNNSKLLRHLHVIRNEVSFLIFKSIKTETFTFTLKAEYWTDI